jgi:hypothetical protein
MPKSPACTRVNQAVQPCTVLPHGFAIADSLRLFPCGPTGWPGTLVLAIGSGLGAGYLLSIFYAPDAAINTWQITLVDLGFLKEG